MKSTIGIAAVALGLLSACGDNNRAASSCFSVGGASNYSTVDGAVFNVTAVGDSDMGTFATVYPGYTSGSTYVYTGDNTSPNFPAGSHAGVFVTPPHGITDTIVTVSTYLDDVAQTQESASGADLTFTPTNGGDPATYYVSFTTRMPFNGVQLTLNTTDNETPFLVYEFCGTALVP